MAIRVAINGFGRIGRLVLRAIADSGRRMFWPTKTGPGVGSRDREIRPGTEGVGRWSGKGGTGKRNSPLRSQNAFAISAPRSQKRTALPSSSGQDSGFSSRQQGSDSPWGYIF